MSRRRPERTGNLPPGVVPAGGGLEPTAHTRGQQCLWLRQQRPLPGAQLNTGAGQRRLGRGWRAGLEGGAGPAGRKGFSADTLDTDFSPQRDFHLLHQPAGAPGPLAASTASWPEATDQAGSQPGPVCCPGGWPGGQTAAVCGLEGTDAVRPPRCPSELSTEVTCLTWGGGWAGNLPGGRGLAPDSRGPHSCASGMRSGPLQPAVGLSLPASPAPPGASAPAVSGPQRPPAPISPAQNPTRQSRPRPNPFSACLLRHPPKPSAGLTS